MHQEVNKSGFDSYRRKSYNIVAFMDFMRELLSLYNFIIYIEYAVTIILLWQHLARWAVISSCCASAAMAVRC